MANTITIPKLSYDYDKDEYFPLGIGWADVTRYETRERVKPMIRCNCGKFFGIGLHHVHTDSRVTASFYHKDSYAGNNDNKGCG